MPGRLHCEGCRTGNFVAEWFGHRVWDSVDESRTAENKPVGRLCPFLTTATEQRTECVKRASGWDEPYGVCTISSDSNGQRQDWIACPYRTLDQHFTLLASAIRSRQQGIFYCCLSLACTVPTAEANRQAFKSDIRVFLFSSQKLGGEIDLPETEASPGAAVDMSVIEVCHLDQRGKPIRFGDHLFYEIQTSDFHGSPLHAPPAPRDLCPRGKAGKGFHNELKSNVEICGTGVEGPNKANIFKRTIYQMIFKIELSRAPECSGFAIVLPVPVWESWLRHLGRPQLVQVGQDPTQLALRSPSETEATSGERARATIYVFDIDRDSKETPNPFRLEKTVTISAGALIYHSFDLASSEAINRGVVTTFRKSFIERAERGWNGPLNR